MGPLTNLRGASIEHLDAVQRWLVVTVAQGQIRSLTFRVDDGALVATKDHQLLKLEQFQVGNRVSVIYSPQPDGTLLAKSVILERGALAAAGRAVPR
ncbi:MAG: hypothetical protein COV75_02725 [Candidatus Omnitrophica bacterium CG11_big_fil_rev_8_21_14_0_20_63_9]|nr:MAG: hypothetical protein COV75_02725 [Candidatus Omnitrophica bacterium CG11_big_fil_rev_8_21_14_0_20_63_9]